MAAYTVTFELPGRRHTAVITKENIGTVRDLNDRFRSADLPPLDWPV